MKDSNVLDKVALVYGQMNEPPGNRLRVALTGLTPWPRSSVTKAVTFCCSSTTSTVTPSPKCPHCCRMPSAVGYQPTLAEEMGVLQERITSTKKGSITSIQAAHPRTTSPPVPRPPAHLDATVVPSRDIASLGIYPAVDPLDSTPVSSIRW